MSSSYEKVVKLACKPKAAPPKTKYLDTIIAATWSEDGAVHDVCKALSPRFREPNAVIVFKALIVLHTMIRNGATDNVLAYLSSTEVLRLQNVSTGSWEGYAAPQNLKNYATYLDSRIKAYRDLKHDAVRVQAETNRDMRNSASISAGTSAYPGDADEQGYHARTLAMAAKNQGPQRSKTIMGRKLRIMTVEKGLLRETKAVHRMIDTLVECRFYLDDLEDELTTTALRMLVKDLLILFQAGNEGVINVLEHYFEMSHVDAEQALVIYRHFCQQTERVVEFLGVAKKLQNLLNVPIPNLKHAPVSLAGALQEYLDDTNFEQNRIEYKTNKETAERNLRKGARAAKNGGSSSVNSKLKTPQPPLPVSPTAASSPGNTNSQPSVAVNGQKKPDAMVDFFSAIEEEQPTMFNPQTNSPSQAYFQQQAASNPFVQRQMTGQAFAPQNTGFVLPQQTGNPFGMMQQPNMQTQFMQPPFQQQQQQQQQQLQPQPTGHLPFSSFLQPQSTGFPGGAFSGQQTQQQQPTGFQPQSYLRPQPKQGFLQPQATGAPNPFRQSMLMPQSTGAALFMDNGNNPMATGNGMNAFQNQTRSVSGAPFGQAPTSAPFSGPGGSGTANGFALPPRPASTPLTAFGQPNNSSGSGQVTTQPTGGPVRTHFTGGVKTHQTGTRNPFGSVEPAPPVPAVPRQLTMMEIAMSGQQQQPSQQQQQPQSQQPSPNNNANNNGSFGFNSGALSAGGTDMASVASSFAKTGQPSSGGSSAFSSQFSNNPLTSQNTSASNSTAFSSDSIWGTMSSQPTGATTTNSNSSFTPSMFKPSISFQPSSNNNMDGNGNPSSQLSPPLQPQSTGFGGIKAFKPSSSFGASLLESLPTIPGTPSIIGTPLTNSNSNIGFSGAIGAQRTGFGNMNMNGNPSMGVGGGGQTTGMGLRPQMTGGAANPFRASTAMGNNNGSGGAQAPPLPNSFGAGTQFGGSSFGSGAFGNNMNGSSGVFGGQSQQPQQQQQSLI